MGGRGKDAGNRVIEIRVRNKEKGKEIEQRDRRNMSREGKRGKKRGEKFVRDSRHERILEEGRK